MWNHAGCILKKKNQIKFVDDVEGIELLRWDDQKMIRNYVEGGSSSTTTVDSTVANSECTIEVSPTSRATCKHCNQKIQKGTVRVSTKPEGQGPRGLSWHHANCFVMMCPSSSLEKISGWDNLAPQDKENVSAFSKRDTSKSSANADQVTSRSTKRKATETDEQKAKISKSDQNNSSGKLVTSRNNNVPDKADSGNAELEKKLEVQSKLLWDIKDELKKKVSTAELREMLDANGQDSTGSEFDLRDCCADGMLFGALASCPICSGSLRYCGGQYHCRGYLSAWSKCSYSTTEPARHKEKWKIPKDTKNEYLLKWFKSQKAKKPDRVLPPSTNNSLGRDTSKLSQPSNDGRLENLKVAIAGESTRDFEDLKTKLEEAGVKFHMKIKKDTSCLIWTGEVDNNDPEIRKARRMKLPIVREDYLHECIRKQKRLPFDLYKIEGASETSTSGIVTVKVKGRSAVHEASGLQDTGHILEDGKSIYNTTLNMSDLSTGVNSYYILQIIQEDKGSDCYVFRKWGRVGNDKIGGSKLEEMSKSDAIQQFKRLFLEKTGNLWEAWEEKSNFQKQPGRFYPLDIDYGVKQVPKKNPVNMKSQLAPQLLELIKMLFNVETYRAAMLEFEINMSEMPLGKLSKKNIQKGFEALTEIQNLLCSTEHDSAIKESLVIDASNRFFTLIPSIHPHAIRHEDDVKAKVKMLEALQDIEIASRLVGFDRDDDESLDEKYKKLRCGMTPLPHDSEDYQLVEKYLLNTHAPTHKDWTLELEEVFALEREGEFDKFSPYKDKLKNKMLLWHGSRLTNFVGILSQGLRIAPPEAPATGLCACTCAFCDCCMVLASFQHAEKFSNKSYLDGFLDSFTRLYKSTDFILKLGSTFKLECLSTRNRLGLRPQTTAEINRLSLQAPSWGHEIYPLMGTTKEGIGELAEIRREDQMREIEWSFCQLISSHWEREFDRGVGLAVSFHPFKKVRREIEWSFRQLTSSHWEWEFVRGVGLAASFHHSRRGKFGKGIYFADLVSKSAQYCYVDKNDPVGLMLISEVALGEIHELKKATYMDKPPKGKHSTKGLGKTVPLESEFVKWKDEVVVPCGKPVPSSVRASELLYNEYIVYNTNQVKMQFLLKVRFHHKR
ncbi:hypothetical protein Cni_G16160 [Canna indica]|uniref:Poly [ADP-ribose] polymerase n=1 Tax=Canna indica TaxID=4628 RepID=A0AAQ3KEM7_9LILI|nr:hypothetical protein Cni_G16160 [Canna indica]